MTEGETVNGAYVLKERLGKSPFGETWAAIAGEACTRVAPGTELVLKSLALGEAPDWKSLERIENEAAALKAMNHPAVPRYVDSFRLDEDGGHAFTLIMERMPGRSLAAEAESGRRFSESEIETMFADILSVLAYLHSLRPPIIHRDVNPKNVILRPDGSIALVDFSGVQDAVRLAYRDTSTMLGTAGYAPLEQVSGRATIRSDLYAAAATAAFLITRKHPSDLPVTAMRIDPGAVVELSPRLEYVLRSYLDPDEAKRALPPLEASAILRGTAPLPGTPTVTASTAGASGAQTFLETLAKRLVGSLESSMQDRDAFSDEVPEPTFGNAADARERDGKRREATVTLPSDSRVILSSTPELLSIRIPRTGFRNPGFWFSSGFAVFWLGFVAFWTFSALAMGAPIFFAMFSLPFWAVGIFLVRMLLKPALSAVTASFTREGGLVFEERFIGKPRVRSWQLSDLGSCGVENSPVSQNGRHERDIVLETGAKTVRFGRAISERERRVVASSISSWLAAARI
ncbi:MAG: hypothetical protein A2Y38_00985 [Spirochaetes bacterium GWB1_59_5]|nr:MAG: hypothetical protein A2Y38_00985 [Spirochaetes bacterium GWB1_59_5]